MEMWFQKKLRGTSALVLYCIAADLQNAFLEQHLWGTGIENNPTPFRKGR